MASLANEPDDLGADLCQVTDHGDEHHQLLAVEDRLQHQMLRHVTPAPVRVVVYHHVAGREAVEAQLFDRPPHRMRHGAELRRAELALSDHVTLRIEDGARKVLRLAEYGGVRRAHHCRPHLAGDVHQPVVDDRHGDGVDRSALLARAAAPDARRGETLRRIDPADACDGDRQPVVREQEDGRVRLLDDCRPADGAAGTQVGAMVDPALDPGAGVAMVDAPRRTRRRRRARLQLGQRKPCALANSGDVEVGDLDGLVGEVVTVELAVRLVEALEQQRKRVTGDRSCGHGDIALVVLPRIAHADGAQQPRGAGEPLAGELLGGCIRESLQRRVDGRHVGVVRAVIPAPAPVNPRVGRQRAECRRESGMRRHDDIADAERGGDLAAM